MQNHAYKNHAWAITNLITDPQILSPQSAL